MFGRVRFSSFAVPVLAIVVLLMAACAPAAAPQAASEPAAEGEPSKLVVASFYPLDNFSGWDGMIERFKEAHPDVEIEVQVTAGDQYLPKLLSQIAGGDPPDVVGVENTPFPQFVQKEILENLTPYLEKTEGFALDDFYPHLIDRYTVGGDVYGIPYDAQPAAMLFYNPALFDEAGLEYPNEDWTWNDLLEAATQLTESDASGNVERYGYDICGNGSNYFIYSNGGGLADDVKEPTRSLLGEPEAIEGVQFYVDMIHEYGVTPKPQLMDTLGGYPAHTDLFLAGKTAMLQCGLWVAVENPQGFADLGAKMVMAPTGPDGTRAYPTGGTAYAILESSDNKDLAWEFINFFLGPIGYEEAYKASTLGAMYPPGHKPSFDWYLEQPSEFVDTLAPDRDALEYIIFSPANLRWPEINSKCIGPEMDLIVRNEKPVEETMQAVAECVDAELAKE